MSFEEQIESKYFEWMCDIVCDKRFPRGVSYFKLLSNLHNTIFTWSKRIRRDENRAKDGINLRRRFAISQGDEYLDACFGDAPCSVLEMMVALAIRCEESIMDNTEIGDRTTQWFWGMISNLGLGEFNDNNYDEECVENIIQTFLKRKYDFDGKGGLFRVRGSKEDLRKVEIWYQLCWYLDTII